MLMRSASSTLSHSSHNRFRSTTEISSSRAIKNGVPENAAERSPSPLVVPSMCSASKLHVTDCCFRVSANNRHPVNGHNSNPKIPHIANAPRKSHTKKDLHLTLTTVDAVHRLLAGDTPPS